MDWLERYVGAVKGYLPKKIRDDVGEEIGTVLHDKLEEKEKELGRKLKDEELKNWIGSQKHPLLLAASYQERRELVPAEVFPFYLQALKIALVLVLVIQVAGTGFYILGSGDFGFSGIFKHLFGRLLEAGLLAFGSVTVVFHFLGKRILGADFLKKWNVDNLPEVRYKWAATPVGETVFEIVALVFLFAFMYGLYLGKWDIPEVDLIAFNPGFHDLIPWILGAIGLGVAHRIWRVARPHWTVPKLIAGTGIGVLSLGILIMVLSLDPILFFEPEIAARHPGLERGDWLARTVTYSLYVVFAVNLYELGRDLYRIYLLRRA